MIVQELGDTPNLLNFAPINIKQSYQFHISDSGQERVPSRHRVQFLP